MKTIMITGCSSGFGLETARYFLERDWTVIATMRTPKQDILPASDRLRILPLDVTDPASIVSALEAAGDIDVLVNNAGIGWLDALEGMSMKTIRQLFETNTFATMAMTQAILPQFRAQKSGIVINVTSSTTMRALPLLSVYTASKAAINAFTESVAIELAEFGIRAIAVIPGRAPGTSFVQTAQAKIAAKGGFSETYSGLVQTVMGHMQSSGENAPITYPQDVAEAIWQAATDPDCPTRLPAGADAVEWAKAG